MQVAMALSHFCARDFDYRSDRVFVLNGYAGTGKTSLLGALVKALRTLKIDTVLMAPTGRAAKVLSSMAGVPASTIHRRIYAHSLDGLSGAPRPRENKLRGAVFIVDEASMIGEADENGYNLLADLIHFVYGGENCRLILLGDTAQLPPVGQQISPAMDPEALRAFGLKVTHATMTEVARQGAQSGILYNATRMRRALMRQSAEDMTPVPIVTNGGDVQVVEPNDLPDLLDGLYRADGVENTIVITRSNRTAVDFNRGIRTMVLGHEEELLPGDLMIAAKNNYFWTKKVKGLDFVANGEILEVVRVVGTEERYGMRFADVTFTLPDNHEVEFTAKIVMACFVSHAASLEPEYFSRLYRGVYEDRTLHEATDPHDVRTRRMRESPYWNALLLKYAYAVTCHKAQGGQWRNVLVDLSYIPPEQVGGEFYRWLYTAITRSYSKLYLINPPEELVK